VNEPRPVTRTTGSLSVAARSVAFEVLLPVMANTPLPSEAKPPAAQMPTAPTVSNERREDGTRRR
jgi:hypothetical protein